MIACCRSRRAIAVLAVILTFAGGGCSRMFWRSQADFDTYNLLQQKQFDHRWNIPRSTVEPDPRSRFYDPFEPDCPPLPPDDPAAGQYMDWVYGMRGYKSWHEFGESMSVENPGWLGNFNLSPDMRLVDYETSDGLTTVTDPAQVPYKESAAPLPTIENLTLAQSVELANINSRDYQTQIENTYLSALQLTFDQFQFNVRYLGVGGREPTGNLNYTNIPSTSDNLSFNSRAGISQVLPTGGQWVVEMANNTLWLFSGGNQTNSASVLSYSLVQPLLFGAGRKIVLENLTQSEREVLYDLRTLARYRKLFFADTVSAGAGGSGGNVGAAAVGGAVVVGTTASASVGYLALLQQSQQIRNNRDNIRGLYVQAERQRELISQTPFRRLKPGAFPEGIEFPPGLAVKIEYLPASRLLRWKDVEPMSAAEEEQLLAISDNADYRTAIRELYDQLRTGVTTADTLQLLTQLTQQETQLRTQERTYADAMDRYKIFLGLPTDMQVTIDLSLLQQFRLIDPRINQLEIDVLGFADFMAGINAEEPPLDELRAAADQLAELIRQMRADGLTLVEDDFAKVDANTPLRLSRLKFDASRELVEDALERDRVIFRKIQDAFASTTSSQEELRKRLSTEELSREDRRTALVALRDVREELFTIVQNLRVVQVGLRAELITLPDFDMSQEDAVAVALENRLDLMNARGRVMDARRGMEVAANRLEAVLNLVAAGDIGTRTPGNHPFDFRGDESSFRFGVQMTAPLDQVAERNAYRASLVVYQRARREYMRQEDQVKFEVRTDWRQMNVARLNFETSRKNLRQAALQLDIVVANANDPSRQQVGRAGTTSATGNTGLQLLNALNAVLRAQNDLITTWVDHERNRINIYRDMDIMEIDERGLWRDPVYQSLPGASPSHPSEPTDVQPAEPLPASVNTFQHEPIAGVVRLAGGTRPSAASQPVGRASARPRSAGWSDWWRNRLLARDSGAVDAHDFGDGWIGDRDGETSDLPDHGDREGDARQHAERLADE